MTDKAARDLITRLIDGIDRGDTSVMDEVFHDDAVMDLPASRERVASVLPIDEPSTRTCLRFQE